MRAGRTARRRAGARGAAAAIAAVAAAWPLAQVAFAGPAAPDVPATIAVEDGHKAFLAGHAVGVQIWGCNATGDGYAWSLVAPRANLLGDNGKLVATHFGGPTWQATDGSQVKAQRVSGVTVDATAIPWLLLEVTAKGPRDHGGRLGRTTFIQRIATTGGLAPAAGSCSVATAGTQQEVPYTADYLFWKSTGRG